MHSVSREGPAGSLGGYKPGLQVVAQGHQRVHLRHDGALFGEGAMES